MKLTVIKLIASVLLSISLVKYMSQNSSAFQYIMDKHMKLNKSTPNNKSVVITRKRENVPTAKIAMQDCDCFYYS